MTPEYNFSIPGLLKSVIDWLSRPPGESVLEGKPVAIGGASPTSMGTRNAQRHLREILDSIDADLISDAEVAVARAHQLMSGGELRDERVREEMERLLIALAARVREGSVDLAVSA